MDGAGNADADAIWSAFREDGYSVRLVHPQQWHPPLYELCATLQEYFGFTVRSSLRSLSPGATDSRAHAR